MLMNARGGPPILRGGPPLGTISMDQMVYLIEVLEIMAQMLQYIIFLSLKAIKVSSDFILNYLKKVAGGATTHMYQKQMLKP